MPALFFTPQDNSLIIGSPIQRRRFLNLHLSQSDPLYVHHLIRFLRSMKQRNSLLRVHPPDGIACWEQQMAYSATYLYGQRKRFLSELQLELENPLHSTEPFDIRFSPSQSTKEPLLDSYLAQLSHQRRREQQLGFTLTGPHRDDVTFLLQSKQARLYASEGQRRSALALLRLAEWKRMHQQTGIQPLFGIDDFELHLDQERQNRFRATLASLGQVFVSTPEERSLWPNACSFLVQAGSVL